MTRAALVSLLLASTGCGLFIVYGKPIEQSRTMVTGEPRSVAFYLLSPKDGRKYFGNDLGDLTPAGAGQFKEFLEKGKLTRFRADTGTPNFVEVGETVFAFDCQDFYRATLHYLERGSVPIKLSCR